MHIQNHTQCVTEHEKYAQAATKPGGKAYGQVNDRVASVHFGNLRKLYLMTRVLCT